MSRRDPGSRGSRSPTIGSVAERLERSRAILDLPDDWDGEGSPGYAERPGGGRQSWSSPLRSRFVKHADRIVPLPIITKGDGGSIDVQWRTPTRNILVNVPANDAEAVTFYAHDRERRTRDIGGNLEANGNGWLLDG